MEVAPINRFLDIVRCRPVKWAAVIDLVVTTKRIVVEDHVAMKAILTAKVIKFDGVSEPIAAYDAEIDIEKVKGLRDLACEV